MDKHAYLILCHKNAAQIILLLQTLDDERNDLYIHIDKKSKSISEDLMRNAVSRSKIFFTKRLNIGWGCFSMVRAELLLLQEAIDKNHYSYFHLLSGQDLPIKSQDEICAFFRENMGKEFVQLGRCLNKNNEEWKRIGLFHLFKEYHVGKDTFLSVLFRDVDKISLVMQEKFKINRIRGKENCYYRGSQWFSITYDFAEYILSREKWIKRRFKWTACADEILIATIAYNSRFRERMYPNMRLVDWERGTSAHPYTFTSDDFSTLKESDRLFARKFDEEIDSKIIDRVIHELCCPKQRA